VIVGCFNLPSEKYIFISKFIFFAIWLLVVLL
jgi:hypothetical protein